MTVDQLRSLIRDVPDFPKEGILFRDVTPLLLDPAGLNAAIEAVAEPFKQAKVDRVLGIEARGFIFGAPIAQALGAGFGLVRKAGKLPWESHSASYELEYGIDRVEMHVDTVEAGHRVLIVDDLIATGGTAAAAVELVRKAGGEMVGCSFLIELLALGGREKLDTEFHSVLTY
ncbi:MAG: adenine phosphoribosyltransferase [Deltaproteobacteria bacterium]|nr:adenine phosphoribosyltransferase [Deltaproteobacteria bacterium]MBW2395711.1 adenine phosphoribosyltransferase [Deltaproteobacteria bacterium]